MSIHATTVTGMDAELAGLASAAATTVVKLLTTNAWQAARDGVVAVWRKAHPEHTAQRVQEDLDDAHGQLSEQQDDKIEPALVQEWQARLSTLLITRPGLATDLRALLEDQLRPALRRVNMATRTGSVRQDGTARDHSVVIQGGGSVTITGSAPWSDG